jgi:hypothetical protein
MENNNCELKKDTFRRANVKVYVSVLLVHHAK